MKSVIFPFSQRVGQPLMPGDLSETLSETVLWVGCRKFQAPILVT